MTDHSSILSNKKVVVREANELVEAKYLLDMWEARIFWSAIAKISPDDQEFKKYKIYIKDLERDFGIKDKDIYSRMRSAAKSLRKKEIAIPYRYEEGMGDLVTGLITSYGGLGDDTGAFVVVELHPDLKPYLLQLKQRYTQYNIGFLMRMQSRYSRRIYKLLKQYQKIGKRKLNLARLRELLCIEPNEYAKYSHLKSRIIKKAQKDLEEYTDICFEFKEIKKGRKVDELVFYIFNNKKDRLVSSPNTTDLVIEPTSFIDVDPIANDLYKPLSKWMDINTFNKITKGKSDAHIKTATTIILNKLKSNHTIDNVVGYFTSLVRKENLKDVSQVRKEKAIAIKNEKKDQAEKKQTLLLQLKKVHRELKEKEDIIIQALFIEEPTVQFEVLEQAKASKLGRSFYNEELSLDANLANPAFSATYRNIIINKYNIRFEALHRKYIPRINAMKQQM